eukprot:gene6496-13112_t
MNSDAIIILGNIQYMQSFFASIQVQSDCISWQNEIISRSNIKKIILSNVRLQSLTEILPHFENLIYLNVSFNNLVELSSINQLKMLQFLDISFNKLSSIDEIKDCIHMKVLKCQYNALNTLEALSYLTSIMELNISNNNIDWNELIFLSSLEQLKTILIYNNPLQDKEKHIEFISSLCPSLLHINGEQTFITSDFLRSQYGRTMLVQARANYPKNQRIRTILQRTIQQKDLNNDFTTLNNVNRPSNGIINADELSNMNGQSQSSMQSETDNLFVRPPLPLQINGNSTVINQFRSQSAASSYVPVFKADRKSLKGAVKTNRNRNRDNANTTGSGSASESVTVEERIVIRFGMTVTTAVAMCLYSDGSGYARWSEGGPMACVLEGGRLLASYRGGGVAVVMDCRAMDHNKKLVASYTRKSNKRDVSNDINNGSGSGSALMAPGNTVRQWKYEGLEISFDPTNWEIKVQVTTSRIRCSFSSIYGGKLIQEYDLIEIVHDKIDNNNSLQSELPNVIISSSSNTSLDKISSKNINNKSSKKNKIQQHTKEKELKTNGVGSTNLTSSYVVGDAEDHTALRTGIQSVVDQLDSILAGVLKT